MLNLLVGIISSLIAASIGTILYAWLRRKSGRTGREVTAKLPEIPKQYGCLEIIEENIQSIWFLEKPETIIGRGSNADIRLVSDTISRNHAKIKHINSNYFILDLGSKNGTLINGVKIEKNSLVELHENDVIEIGQAKLRFFYKEV